MSALTALILREWRIANRVGGGASIGIVFFLTLVSLMPFALGPDLRLLAQLGPAILWIGALLSILLGFERLFQADVQDGALDLLQHAVLPLEIIVLAKSAVHWLHAILPLILLSPLLGLMLGIPVSALGLTALSLLTGTPALTMIGALGAALTASLPRGGLLLALLALPLSIPVLIFGAATASTEHWAFPLAALFAISLFAVSLAPFAIAAALKRSRE